MIYILNFLCAILLTVNCAVFASEYVQPFAPYYSQEGQDKYVIEKFFKDKKDGVFFDIGAHDGISYSNTYFLEKELGWTGVCVEPQDDNFEKLILARNCICIHGCIYKSSGLKEFLQVNGPSEMLSGLLESYDPRHLERAKKEVEEFGGSLEIILVETFTLNEVCKDNDITHIDFLSIDTEGSEELIIKSIDFDQIDISVIAVENNYRENNIKTYLHSKGYVYDHTIGGDDIFVKFKK